jgi:hypothetical protein
MDYGTDYYQLMRSLNTRTAEEINLRRWDLISLVPHALVLDYGCGLNFLAQYAPAGTTVDSFDIGRLNGNPYPQTGLLHERYEVVALFDVLEHVEWRHAPDEHMLEAIAACEAVALTVPILPPGTCMADWKHYKPGEHLTYFRAEDVQEFFDALGFCRRLVHDQRECPPRQDIHSFLFARGA